MSVTDMASDQTVTDGLSKPCICDVKNIADRKDFFRYACDLNMDRNTVNGWLTLSDENKKATYGNWQDYPDRIERFDKWPQVLCTEGLTGRHYWEVEWGKGHTTVAGVGITYNKIERKGASDAIGLGYNSVSWYFGVNKGNFKAWHNNQSWSAPQPLECSRVGVYLDWPAGTLSFYDVTLAPMKHIYTFNAKFTDVVYPGFWIEGKPNYVYLCPL